MKVNDTERLESYARFKVKQRPIDCVKMIPVSTRLSRYYGHGFIRGELCIGSVFINKIWS